MLGPLNFLAFIWMIALIVLSWWQIKSFMRLNQWSTRPVHFTSADLLALMVLLSAAAALAIHVNAMFGGFAWLFVSAIWWIGVRELSRANIRAARLRLAFLLIALPLAYTSVFTVPTVVVMCMQAIDEIGIGQARASARAILGSCFANFALLAIPVVCGLITRRLNRARIHADEPSAPGEP